MTTPACPYCGSATEIKDSAVIYTRSYGPILMCSRWPACDAYVGCHRGTTTPKGTMANPHLRWARKEAHRAFDPLWLLPGDKNRHRVAAYAWLSQVTGIAPEACHIGMMSAEQCQLVIDHSLARRHGAA